jgi:hypothetical protein
MCWGGANGGWGGGGSTGPGSAGYTRSMPTSDTNPQAARVQVEVWRRMGPEGRSRAAAALSESLMRTARDQIVAARPDWTPRQVTLALIARLHGADLAQRVNKGVPVPLP